MLKRGPRKKSYNMWFLIACLVAWLPDTARSSLPALLLRRHNFKAAQALFLRLHGALLRHLAPAARVGAGARHGRCGGGGVWGDALVGQLAAADELLGEVARVDSL